MSDKNENEIRTQALLLEIHNSIRELIAINKGLDENGEPKNEYYNTPQTVIQVATPNPPAGGTLDPTVISSPLAVPPTPGYQVEGIYTQLRRKSSKVTVINDGTCTLYAITTSDGSAWSRESPILIGEARTLFNVWELRLRSPTAGNLTMGTGGIYRVTEYDFWLAYSSAIAAASLNRDAFTALSVQPISNNILAPTQLPDIAVPNGFELVVRATVGNATVIYLANSAANVAVATGRITLNAGDPVHLAITNANLVFVAGLGPGVNNVDILVEQ